MRRILLVLYALCLPSAASALTPDLGRLDELPLHVAPAEVTAKAVADARAVKGSGPFVFAATVPLPVALDGGRWDRLDAQTARWRTRVYSAGALSLVMEFAAFQLPPSAKLWIYDAEGRVVQGPYDAANHSPEGTLWTAMVPGETAVIELQVPASARDTVALELGRLGHGFRNTRDLGGSGACNVDVACPLGGNWAGETRATVKLQIPGLLTVGLCSGTLVNNSAQNDTPYVLTANHCGITSSNASGVVAYWGFQNSTCNGADDASAARNQTGAALRASDRDTDMTLIQLNQRPSAAFNVHYAGWDASGAGGNSGVSIHHPSGDAKKISEFTQALVATTVQIQAGGPNIPAWRVNRWTQGTTEPGSSGAALWNQSRRIVGTLSGGSAACSGSVGNDQPDFYAQLHRQWTARSAASGQLKAWLDPGGSCSSIAGKNPGSASPLPCSGSTTGGGGGGSLDLALLCLLAALGLARRSHERRI